MRNTFKKFMGITQDISNRRSLVEGFDEEEIASPTGDNEAIQRLVIVRSRYHP